jgi:hypothetical protein
MEGDSIRASGTDTLVDIWIDGKMRAIRVSLEAIGAFSGFERAAAMTDEERCDFVRRNLPLVVSAAKTRLHELGPATESIPIESGQLPSPDGAGGERRRIERRKSERRVSDQGRAGGLPDRRRIERRRGQRRRIPRAR